MEGAPWENSSVLSSPEDWTVRMVEAQVEQTRDLHQRREPGLTQLPISQQHRLTATLPLLGASPGENPPARCLANQGCPLIRFYIKIWSYSETIPSNINQKYAGLRVREAGLQAKLCPQLSV